MLCRAEASPRTQGCFSARKHTLKHYGDLMIPSGLRSASCSLREVRVWNQQQLRTGTPGVPPHVRCAALKEVLCQPWSHWCTLGYLASVHFPGSDLPLRAGVQGISAALQPWGD